MNILILNNNNLPESLSEQLISIDKDFSIDSQNYIELQSGKSNFDHYVHNELSRIFKDKPTFDLIILPYSFSSENYMELTGLTTALHIRLTQKWGQTHVPLLFIGPDPKEEIERFSSYGILLETSCVYTTQYNEGSKVYSLIQTLRPHRMSDEQYHVFLNRIKIERPSNYPTHHSIANEWCLMRWKNILIWANGNMPVYSDEHFESMLYVKYIMAVNSSVNEEVTGEWKTHNSFEAKILNIKGKRICLIDDKIDRGWGEFFKKVLENSEADFKPYTNFNPSYGRDELIKHIRKYIDDNDKSIDVYILDLRLHESDTYAQPENLTGHEIAKYIHKTNAANQVIILTASNKVWNYQKDIDECHAYGYVVKESPEASSTLESSAQNFERLSELVGKAASLSFFKEYVDFVDKEKKISDVNLQLIKSAFVSDKTLEKNVTWPILYLNIVEFIKNHCRKSFKYAYNRKVLSLNSLDGKFTRNISATKQVGPSPYYNTIKISFTTIIGNSITEKDYEDLEAMALYYYYGLSQNQCNIYVKAKLLRNTQIAHNGGVNTFSFEEEKRLIYEVLMTILKTDY